MIPNPISRELNVPKALNKRIKFGDSTADKFPEATISMESDSGLECPLPSMSGSLQTPTKSEKAHVYSRKDTFQMHQKVSLRAVNATAPAVILFYIHFYDTRGKYHQATKHKIYKLMAEVLGCLVLDAMVLIIDFSIGGRKNGNGCIIDVQT
jgi:hypothetical protein